MQVAEKHAQGDIASGKILHKAILCVCVLRGSETHAALLTAVTFGTKKND